MPTPLPPDNSAYSDSPAGLCFGSNTSQKKTYELCLKDSFWIPVSLFPAFFPSISEGTNKSLLFILAFREFRLSQPEKPAEAQLGSRGAPAEK